MLTPVDIQNKEFTKSLSGYNKEMVDDFVLEVSKDFEKLYKENIELKDRLSVLNESLKKYRASYNTNRLSSISMMMINSSKSSYGRILL